MNVLSETCSNTSQDASKTHQTCVYLLFIIMLVGEFKKTGQTPSHPNYKYRRYSKITADFVFF